MPTRETQTTDPDGQVLMNALTELGVSPADAYNVTQGVRNMSGQNVIARIDAMEASTNARLEAMEASTNARLDAIQATTSARFDAVDTQLDIMGWGVMLTLGIVAAMGGKGFFRRTERRERSEDSAAVSASRHTES